jgi:hypothetical protein
VLAVREDADAIFGELDTAVMLVYISRQIDGILMVGNRTYVKPVMIGRFFGYFPPCSSANLMAL